MCAVGWAEDSVAGWRDSCALAREPVSGGSHVSLVLPVCVGGMRGSHGRHSRWGLKARLQVHFRDVLVGGGGRRT